MIENLQTVLVVDDQPEWLDLMVTLLKDDFAVFQASSHNAALKVILEQDPPFHVVVTDLRLIDKPNNEEGLTLIEQLNRAGGETQTIVITGYPTIDTTRKALGQLRAFDYLLKVPENGDFNPAEFRRTVWRAAQQAERWRSNAFVRSDWHILVIESNDIRRKTLAEILNSDGYRVDELSDIVDLAYQLNRQEKPYDLMMVNELFIERDANLAPMVQRYHPECQIIILTEKTIDNTLRNIQEGIALRALPIHTDKFDPQILREAVKQVFAPATLKYAIASFEGTVEGQPLQVGVPYNLSIQLQDIREIGATAIWLGPSFGKYKNTHLKVFVQAREMKLRPDSEAAWNIPSHGRPNPFIVEVTPQTEQTTTITIELTKNNHLLGRIEKEVTVDETER
jgi:DNA-binding NtrC family response regulator